MSPEYPKASSLPNPGSEARAIDRRGFLKLSGASLAGVALAASFPGGALARGEASPGSSLAEEFEEAAAEYRVPLALLMAIGYVNTRWEMPPPEANDYERGNLHGWGSYGIMALVQNPYSNTLGEASRLTGIPEERLKTDRRSNILGGAALLAESLGSERPTTLEGYRGAVAGRGSAPGKNYEAVAGMGGGELFAEQVLEALRNGVREEKLKSGERLSLSPRDLTARIGGV